MTTLIEAAQARGADSRAPADRPRERRCAEKAGPLVAGRAVVRRPIKVREASQPDSLDFSGYASVTDTPYEMHDFFGPYTEIVIGGAFEKTLKTEDLDVPLVLGHDSMRRLARTTNGSLTLTEDDTGLLAEAPGLDPADADVAYIAPKLRSGLIDEMSFRFQITEGAWSADWTEYHLIAAEIHRGDVSIVGYGASPHTSAELRSLVDALAGGRDPADLTGMDVALLRSHDKTIRRELQRRGVKPSMTLQDLLAI